MKEREKKRRKKKKKKKRTKKRKRARKRRSRSVRTKKSKKNWVGARAREINFVVSFLDCLLANSLFGYCSFQALLFFLKLFSFYLCILYFIFIIFVGSQNYFDFGMVSLVQTSIPISNFSFAPISFNISYNNFTFMDCAIHVKFTIRSIIIQELLLVQYTC